VNCFLKFIFKLRCIACLPLCSVLLIITTTWLCISCRLALRLSLPAREDTWARFLAQRFATPAAAKADLASALSVHPSRIQFANPTPPTMRSPSPTTIQTLRPCRPGVAKAAPLPARLPLAAPLEMRPFCTGPPPACATTSPRGRSLRLLLLAGTRASAGASTRFSMECLHSTECKFFTKVLFSSQKFLQNFSDSPSHRIFRHMHEALNIDKK
jgi:hypothetical protein